MKVYVVLGYSPAGETSEVSDRFEAVCATREAAEGYIAQADPRDLYVEEHDLLDARWDWGENRPIGYATDLDA